MAAAIQRIETLIDKTLEAGETNGILTFFGQNPEGKGWENVFSFVYFYIPSNTRFEDTKYFKGLRAYVNFVHDDTHKSSTGMIVYTDAPTIDIMRAHFPLENYPNLIYAVPDWPYFKRPDGMMERSTFRTLRYQAVDHFSAANVHMRDADTLFPAIVGLFDEENAYKVVRDWEDTYIGSFLPKIAEKQIILGTTADYNQVWHRNLPYPIDFTFPLKYNSLSEHLPDINLPKHIFVRDPRSIGHPIPFLPYHYLFRTKYTIRNYMGVFAGFSSVLKNREGIENFWGVCVEYLLSRYVMTRNSISNEFHTKSVYSIGKDERMLLYDILPRFLPKIFLMDIPYDPKIDSDLRRLLKRPEDLLEFSDTNQNLLFYTPQFFETYDFRTSNHYTEEFIDQIKNQVERLKEFKEKYPTKENFWDSVEENLRKAVPPEELIESVVVANKNKLKRNMELYSPYVNYEKAGRKATVRHGGARKKRRSKTQKKRGAK
jgi:hypothetical protein